LCDNKTKSTVGIGVFASSVGEELSEEVGEEQSRSELAELAELRRDSRQTIKTDTDKGGTGRQLK
jgi:hypothetical protein